MLTRWDPMRQFEEFEREMFGSLFNRWLDDRGGRRGWTPAIDVEETTDDLIVRAELPGIRKEDVSISYEKGLLTIRGERRFENENQNRNYHRLERSYGTFTRSFVLPTSVDPDKAEASYEDGVLELVMPKREEARPRQIEIGERSTSSPKQISSGKDENKTKAA